MKRIYSFLFVTLAMLMLSVSTAWADTAYVKVTAPDGVVSWIPIVGTIDGTNIVIYREGNLRTIDVNTKGSIDLNEVWSQSGGSGTHYQVTNIGDYAFVDCSGLTSVTIGNGVTSIGRSAFASCHGLTSVVIPSSVTSIGTWAFGWCSGLTSIEIPSSVTSIAGNAFSDCTDLTSIVVESGNSVYDSRNNCNAIIETTSNTLIAGCKNTMIPSSVTSIGNYAFYGCSGLTSIEIPSSVTSIGESAFYYCSGLTSIEIPKSVISIGSYAFSKCENLDLVTINSNTILSNNYSTSTNLKNIFGEQVTKYVIGENVTSIGNYAFYGCSKLTSVSIPNSVTGIGNNVFQNCSGLTSIEIPNSVTSIGNSAFSDCSGLKKVIVKDIAAWCNIRFGNYDANPLYHAHHLYSDENTEITELNIPSSVISIGNRAFQGCSDLTSVEIPFSVTSIGENAFCACKGLTSIEIPSSVTNIGDGAFYGCSGLTSFTLGNNVTNIGSNAFPNTATILVNKGTKSLITLWNNGISAYDISTGENIPPSSISLVSSAQTSVTVTVADYYNGYTYAINDEKVNKGEEKTFSGMSHSLTLRVSLDDVSYSKDFSFKSKGLDLKINAVTTSSSSINVVCSYTHGDAVVTSEEIYVNGKKVSDGNTYYISGLDPNTTYTIMYSTNFESISEKVRTAPLILTTSQPKVISSGNVVVAAETNLDNEETNVGFEWRRTDWTNDFTSNSGTAYLYNGTMEGYIRNLNTEKLWKYRPYYTSNAGYSYYGEWVGIDPTNTSYFEPTVHTYANVSVNGNSAEVKGYVQRGTDNVVSRGFAYWKQSEDVKAREAKEAAHSMISSLPSNAMTVEVSGSQQVMTASISNLEYETTYCYVAFVKTAEGDTFYGEPREFTTDIDVTGIRDVNNENTVTVIQRYDQNGLRLSSPRRGLNILLMSDGSTKKVWVK